MWPREGAQWAGAHSSNMILWAQPGAIPGHRTRRNPWVLWKVIPKSIHWKAKIWQAIVSALRRHTKWKLIMKYRAGLDLSFSCLHITQSKHRLSQMLPDTAAGKADHGLLHPTSETSTHVLPISSTEEWKHFLGDQSHQEHQKVLKDGVLHYLGQKRQCCLGLVVP